MILQSALRFFMDALTFIFFLFLLRHKILCLYLLFFSLDTNLCPYYLYLNTILPFVKSYGDISNLTLSPGKIRM